MQPSEKNSMIAPLLNVADCSLIADGDEVVMRAPGDMVSNFVNAAGFRAAQHVSDLLPFSAKRVTDFEGPHLAGEMQLRGAALAMCVNVGGRAVATCASILEAIKKGRATNGTPRCGGQSRLLHQFASPMLSHTS